MDRVDYESLIIQDLLNFYSNKTLDINPWYQRRSIWSQPQKSYLINTIHERKPVPSIYIRHKIDIDREISLKEVVDGQQRIRAVISYRNDELSARHPNYSKKMLFSELNRNEKTIFLSTAIAVGYLIGASDQDVIEIFGRINSVSKSLNPQEKRNSRFSGEFKQICLRQAAQRLPFWRSTNIFTANDIARMQEVQFISDFIINMLEGISDFSANKIDNYYKKYDDEFDQSHDIENRLEYIFENIVSMPSEVFSDTIFQAPQILFSLMLIIDSERHRHLSKDKIISVIQDLDAKIVAFRDVGTLDSAQTELLQGFTGGNLHRIRGRRIRDKVLRESLD